MLAAWLAGAAAVAALDALVSPGLASTPLRREVLLIVGLGDLGLAALVGLALRLARLRVANGAACLASASLALAPLLAGWLDSRGLGLAVAALLAAAALRGARQLELPVTPVRALAITAVAGLLGAAALEPTLQPALPSAAAVEPDGRPDLLLLSIDTLRADAPPACTPNLRRLAARGVSAEYALAPSSLTLPSHVTMLSGRLLEQHGVFDNHARVPPVVLLSERLRQGGYRTAAVVSNYLVRAEAGFGRGVEVYDEAPVVHAGPIERFRGAVARATWWGWLGAFDVFDGFDAWLLGDAIPADADRGNARRTTDHAVRLLRQLQAQPAPYYLFVHYMDPHDPYVPPAGGPCGSDDAERADWRRLRRIAWQLRQDPPSAERERARAKALYDGEVGYVDQALGELLDQVEAAGRPTVVLLTADHGEQFGDHGQMTHGDSVYEAGLRVPFVLAGPGIPARRLPHPPHLVDVAPTLLARAGLDRSELPGLDLGREIPGPRPHLARAGPHAALRDASGFKLMLELDGRGAAGRLYALGADPGELRDLRLSEDARFARLERELRTRAGAARSAPRDSSDEHLSALEALGYVD